MKAAKKVSKKIIDGKLVYAIIYSRTNTRALQSEQKMSQQEQRCVKFALAHGYIVKEDAIFREIASGKERYQKRPVLVKILDYIDQFPKRRFVLIVADMGRISRNKHDFSAYGEALYSRGVLIESRDCPSKQSVEERLSEAVDSIFKWYERNVRRERMLSAKRDRSGVGHK